MENLALFDEVIDCGNEDYCRTRNFCVNLVKTARTIICVWRLDGTLVKFNNYAEIITGFSEEEVLGYNWRNTIVDEGLESKALKLFDELFNKDSFYASNFECKLLCKNGSFIDILWSNYFMYDKKGSPEFLVGLGMNITAQKKDELTSLANKASLSNKTSLEILKLKQNNEKLALLYIDLDIFKTINDTLGHSAGNKLLNAIASRLQTVVKDTSNLARLGEDEFAILFLYNGDIEEIKTFTEKVMNLINLPALIDGKEIYITASIGIAIYNEHENNFENLIENAEVAMYYAKELGRNRYCFFTRELNERIIERLDLVASLRNAYKNNELELYYQPQINLKTNVFDGMEALIRWIHPEKGMISPLKFIPIAEETGLIIPIGNKVLFEACRQNKAWQNAGYPSVRVAVNLSSKQFEQQDLVETIKKVLEETELEPKYLEIEITESIIMKDFDFSIKILNKLREMGVHVSLDDFGTGYSSLNYLKSLPIDTLKVDKSFIDNIKHDVKDEMIAKTVIELAHNLGLEVVAEGVEYSEQLNILKQQKCDKVQGYFFSRPLPPKEFEKEMTKF